MHPLTGVRGCSYIVHPLTGVRECSLGSSNARRRVSYTPSRELRAGCVPGAGVRGWNRCCINKSIGKVNWRVLEVLIYLLACSRVSLCLFIYWRALRDLWQKLACSRLSLSSKNAMFYSKFKLFLKPFEILKWFHKPFEIFKWFQKPFETEISWF